MIYPSKIINQLIEIFKADDYLGDIKIVRAFEPPIKPTLLKTPAIALGIKEINIDEACVGGDAKRGSVSIFANIYIPIKCRGASAEEIMCRICACADCFGIASVSAGEMVFDSKTECFAVKTAIAFNGEIMIGGNDE